MERRSKRKKMLVKKPRFPLSCSPHCCSGSPFIPSFHLCNPVLPGSIHIPSTHCRSPLEYFMKKMESAELQVGALPHILFKSTPSRPIRSRPLGSSPDKLCELASGAAASFCVCVAPVVLRQQQQRHELTLDRVV